MTDNSELSPAAPAVRYKKPNILTVDLPLSLAERLRAAGYNVLPGTFGRPYRVKKGDGFAPVVEKASVPNYAEQEVVVIDPGPAERNRLAFLHGMLAKSGKARSPDVGDRPQLRPVSSLNLMRHGLLTVPLLKLASAHSLIRR